MKYCKKGKGIMYGAFVLAMWITVIVVCATRVPNDHYYYISDGHGGWTEMVDRPCVVRSIGSDGVIVETRNGNELYAFDGDGFRVGEKIVCTFNMSDELIDVR